MAMELLLLCILILNCSNYVYGIRGLIASLRISGLSEWQSDALNFEFAEGIGTLVGHGLKFLFVGKLVPPQVPDDEVGCRDGSHGHQDKERDD